MQLLPWISLTILHTALAGPASDVHQGSALSDAVAVRATAVQQPAVSGSDDYADIALQASATAPQPAANSLSAQAIIAWRKLQEHTTVHVEHQEGSSDDMKVELRPGPVWSGLSARVTF